MKALVILQLAVLAFSAAASAQTTTTLINDTWMVGRDYPAWSVEMIDTSDKHSGTSSLLIDSPLFNNMTGNMAVFLNTESTAPYVNPNQTLTPNIGTTPTQCSLTFWAKLNSQGVWKNTGQTYGQMQFQVSILNNMWGNSGTATGTLQQFGNANGAPATGIVMNADDQWHQYTLPFTAWVNNPATMSLWTTLGNIEIYHQDWGGNGFGDGTGTDILLHVDDFELVRTSPPPPPPHHKGDFNNDGKVDLADYLAWADYYGKNPLVDHPTYWPGGGYNHAYNDADYTEWADAYGKGPVITFDDAAPPTPEPLTMSLLALGGFGLLYRRPGSKRPPQFLCVLGFSAIGLAILASASPAMAAVPHLTWTVTKAPPSYNANGTPIITANDNIYDVTISTCDPTGCTTGGWALNIISACDDNGTIYQMLGGRYADTPVDTYAVAMLTDAPSHPTSFNYKNCGYAAVGDTWLGNNFHLIGTGNVFTSPIEDASGNITGFPNEWDVCAGTSPDVDLGNIVVGQWAVKTNGDLAHLKIKGYIARSGVEYSFDTIYIPIQGGYGPGDFNQDHVVNDADYTCWADNFSKVLPANYRQGCGLFGAYNDADYTLWADNFGKTTAATPEPASLSLLLLGAGAMLRRRKA